MDRLCDRQLDQSLKQPKEAASGYGLSGRTIAGQALRQIIRSVSEAAERSSQWIWINLENYVKKM